MIFKYYLTCSLLSLSTSWIFRTSTSSSPSPSSTFPAVQYTMSIWCTDFAFRFWIQSMSDRTHNSISLWQLCTGWVSVKERETERKRYSTNISDLLGDYAWAGPRTSSHGWRWWWCWQCPPCWSRSGAQTPCWWPHPSEQSFAGFRHLISRISALHQIKWCIIVYKSHLTPHTYLMPNLPICYSQNVSITLPY